ncbi:MULTISPECIES: hypothetical protein [Paenibacillus]|nr:MULTISPECIES: hypothetical protein [Paenibacillus]MBP1312015.1 hypothetical protein [Paenibacillus sp. 1182]MCH6190051.1 hypothetical protein [Paenibacillus polymyxa]UMY53405.1 hypothetical protein MLD56_17720 [Paenibacillus peoriae]WRL58630.1 hypothetical protein U3G77_10450 [Paenibacillus polymyxa]
MKITYFIGRSKKDRQALLSKAAFAVVEQYIGVESQKTGCFQGRGKAAT